MDPLSMTHHSQHESIKPHDRSRFSRFIKSLNEVQGNANPSRKASFAIGLVFFIMITIISIMVLAVSFF